MKTSLLIMLNKVITLTCKLFKKEGSVFPASIVRKFDVDILNKIKYPKYVIGVTGSSGKGSTTSMIAHILSDNNYKVVWNKSGSNATNGATTLILNNSGLFSHKVKADVLLLELDESYIRETFKNSTLTHLVVTNITRDQPARNGEPELVLKKIKESIDDDTKLIINADDPMAFRIGLGFSNVILYGIEKSKYSITKPVSNNLDSAYCPICHSKLEYKYYHYGHIGGWSCPNGSKHNFVRKLDYKGTNLDLKNKTMLINNVEACLNRDVFFCGYYTLAAYAVCEDIGISQENIIHSLNDNIMDSKRLKKTNFGDRCVEMIESKNENNLSYLQSLKYINSHSEEKTIIMGFDNVSRRYKFNDVSWLYDVDFEILDTENINRIFCIGRFRNDVYARLLLANIPKEKIILVDNITDIIPMLKLTRGTIFTMVCFDMTAILKKLFMEENHD